MRYSNMLKCPLQPAAVFLVAFLLSGCAAGPPPGTPPVRATAHVVNVKHYLPVRVGPSLNAGQTGRLLPGEGVYVTQDGGEWCTIESMRQENGQPLAGWVLRRYLWIEGSAGPAVPGPGAPEEPGESQGPGGPQGSGYHPGQGRPPGEGM